MSDKGNSIIGSKTPAADPLAQIVEHEFIRQAKTPDQLRLNTYKAIEALSKRGVLNQDPNLKYDAKTRAYFSHKEYKEGQDKLAPEERAIEFICACFDALRNPDSETEAKQPAFGQKQILTEIAGIMYGFNASQAYSLLNAASHLYESTGDYHLRQKLIDSVFEENKKKLNGGYSPRAVEHGKISPLGSKLLQGCEQAAVKFDPERKIDHEEGLLIKRYFHRKFKHQDLSPIFGNPSAKVYEVNMEEVSSGKE